MTEQLDNQGEAREALSSLVNDYSKRVLSDPRMLGNIVTDLLPDLPRERSLLVTAAEADVAGELTRHVEEHHLDPDTAVQLVARSLTDRRALDPAASTWVTTEYAQALGYRVRPSTPMAPPPPGGGFAPPPPAGGFAPPPPSSPGGYTPPMPPPPTSTTPKTDPQSDWQHQQTSPGGGYVPPSSPPGGGYSPPSGSGYAPPPPSGGGYSQPPGGGYSSPPQSGAGYVPPAPPPGGGYAPPAGGGYGPPPGSGQSGPPLPGQMPWMPPTPPPKKRNLVPLFTAGGLALVVVIYFAVAAAAKIAPFSSAKPKPSPAVTTLHPSPHVSRTTPAPTKTNPEPGLAAGVAPLVQLLPSDVNPVNCKTAQKPQWATPGLVKGLACYDSALGNSGDSIFAYQMNSADNYKASWDNFNTWWGIKPPSGSGCPPSTGQTQGSVPWDDTGTNGGSYYPTTSGQVLECGLLGSKGNEPTYAWAFPTEDAYIIAIGDPNTTFSAIDTWWTNNSDPNASPSPFTPATP